MSTLQEEYSRQALAVRHAGAHVEPLHWSGPPSMVERIAWLARTDSAHLVVDLGCGVGGPAARLAERIGCRVVGIDLLHDTVTVGHERLRRSAPFRGRVHLVRASVERVPLADSSADQVWSLGVVAHVPDVDAFAGEIARILRPGGTLALTEAVWIGERFPAFASTAPRPWRPLRPADVARVLGAAGLTNVRIRPWPGHGRPDPVGVEGGDPAFLRDMTDGSLGSRLFTARRP